MPPTWLVALSWAVLAVAFASAAWIAVDIFGRGYRQHMKIMEIVWPVTGLYFGPGAVAAYRAWGRPNSHRWQAEHGDSPGKPGYASTAVGVSHCGAGCTLGDIIAEFAVFGLGASVAGLTLGAEYVGDYVAAIILGIAFQYFAIAPMRGLSLRKGLIEAAAPPRPGSMTASCPGRCCAATPGTGCGSGWLTGCRSRPPCTGTGWPSATTWTACPG
jgi:hypothetical protein